MKVLFWDVQSTQEIQSSSQVIHDSQGEVKNQTTEAPVTDSASVSTSGNDSKKVSRQDIELVRYQIQPNFAVFSFLFVHFLFYSLLLFTFFPQIMFVK